MEQFVRYGREIPKTATCDLCHRATVSPEVHKVEADLGTLNEIDVSNAEDTVITLKKA